MNTKKDIMKIHSELISKGDLLAARRVFQLLRNRRVTLGLHDTDWNASIALDKIMNPSISARSGSATYSYAL